MKDSLVKMAVATAVFLAVFVTLGVLYRTEIEAWGQVIAGGMGLWGIALGVLLSDMFTLPIPPDAYLAIAITGGMDAGLVIIWASAGSILGGIGAFWLGRLLGRTRFAQRLVAPFRERGTRFIDRMGVVAVVIAALTPIPFSIISTLAGMMGMHFFAFLPATLFRIPRIAGYFLLIRWGWLATAAGG